MRVAPDAGATFTELVADERLADGSRRVHAVTTDTVTPDFEQGVPNAMARSQIAAREIDFFAHGAIVIHSLLARRGVPTGWLTPRGGRDVREIAPGNRPDLFKKPSPLVPGQLRLAVRERLHHPGQVVLPVSLDDVAGCDTNRRT